MDAITMPTMFCPFMPQQSVYADLVEQRTKAWALDFHLIQKEAALRRFNGSRFSHLTTRTFPLASYEDTVILNKWMAWLFLFDDQFDEGDAGRRLELHRQVMRDLLQVLEEGNSDASDTRSYAPGGAIAAAMQNLWRQTYPRMSPEWRQRFAGHITIYLTAYGKETANRIRNYIPDVASYVQLRREAGAVQIALDLLEFGYHIHLPIEIYRGSEFQELYLATVDVVCWCNDIVSIEKEMAHGEVSNLVFSIRQTYGLSWQDAINYANRMNTERVQHFIQASQHLPTYPPEIERDLNKYLEGMRSWMRGNIDWSAETLRYAHLTASIPQETPYLESIL